MPIVLPPLFNLGVTPQRLRQAVRQGVDEFVHAAYVPKRSITLLEAPLARRLEPGTQYRFRIRAAGHAAVHVKDGDGQREFATQDGDFVDTVTPRGTFLKIGVQEQGGEQVHGLLEYVVGVDSPASGVADLINKARRRHGVGEVLHDAALDASAGAHAKAMAAARGTPSRARCLVAVTDNPHGKRPAELTERLVDSLLNEERQREWALAPPHTRIGVGAVTADGRTYFCLEFR